MELTEDFKDLNQLIALLEGHDCSEGCTQTIKMSKENAVAYAEYLLPGIIHIHGFSLPDMPRKKFDLSFKGHPIEALLE